MSRFSVLIVDDEAQMRELIVLYLTKEGYECVEAGDGEEALARISERRFDIIVLDVMMPNMDGLSVCTKVREKSDVPIMFVTARGDEWDKVNGLRIGADDYMVKPFSPRELVARMEALLRRARRSSDDIQQIGPLEMDIKGHKVRVGGVDLSLTLKEFDLLTCFARHIGHVLSRDQLLEMVWGYEYYGNARTVDTHVKTLRMKLGSHAGLVQTVWGIGYKFEV